MKRKTRFVAIITAVLMCSLLSGCKSSDYKKAQELYSSGNYEEAQTVFFKLGDYEDSAQMVEKCEKQKKYQALQTYLKEEAEKINAIQVSDINKKNIALLRACAKTGKAAGQFIEVMACEGGCITGPSTHNDIVSGRRQLAQELLKRKESYETMDR